jgi:hypothetical protein
MYRWCWCPHQPVVDLHPAATASPSAPVALRPYPWRGQAKDFQFLLPPHAIIALALTPTSTDAMVTITIAHRCPLKLAPITPVKRSAPPPLRPPPPPSPSWLPQRRCELLPLWYLTVDRCLQCSSGLTTTSMRSVSVRCSSTAPSSPQVTYHPRCWWVLPQCRVPHRHPPSLVSTSPSKTPNQVPCRLGLLHGHTFHAPSPQAARN